MKIALRDENLKCFCGRLADRHADCCLQISRRAMPTITRQKKSTNNAKHITYNWMAKLARIRIGILPFNTKRNSPRPMCTAKQEIIVRETFDTSGGSGCAFLWKSSFVCKMEFAQHFRPAIKEQFHVHAATEQTFNRTCFPLTIRFSSQCNKAKNATLSAPPKASFSMSQTIANNFISRVAPRKKIGEGNLMLEIELQRINIELGEIRR